MRRVLFFGLIALAGCEGLIGADFDRVARAPDSGATADGSSLADAAALDGGARDAYVPPSACGDTSGLDMAGGYPMGRGCPTRAAQVDVLPPQNPKIKSRAVLGAPSPYVYFTGSPVLRADGTALAVASIGVGEASGFRFALVGFKDGREVLRTELGDAIVGAGAVPAVAADGTIYVQLDKLYAVSSAGVVRWSKSLGPAGSYGVGAPLILGDGTVVVLSDRAVLAVDAGGAPRFSYVIGTVPTDPFFIGAVAASPTGTLHAVEVGGAGVVDGSLLALSASGIALWTKPLSGRPVMGPTVYADGRIYAASLTLAAFLPNGTLESSRALPHESEGGGASLAGHDLWFPGRIGGPYRFDIESGTFTTFEVPGKASALVSYRDGSVVMLRRGLALTPRFRLERWDRAGTSLWTVQLEDESADLYPPAVDPAGNVYATHGSSLYVIGD